MTQPSKPQVLFICNQNSGRSHMAEALLRTMYPDRYQAYSAGVAPSQINHYAIKAMEQIGVGMSTHYAKSIEEYKDTEFDYVVTVCDAAKASCPFFPGKNVLHHSFRSASAQGNEEEILASFTRVREEVKAWIQEQFG